jgi:hypothetical protein
MVQISKMQPVDMAAFCAMVYSTSYSLSYTTVTTKNWDTQPLGHILTRQPTLARHPSNEVIR